MVTRITVIPFNYIRMCLSDNMSLGWKNRRKRIPIISVKNTVFKMLYLLIKSFESFNIATTKHPCYRLMSGTVYCFDEPKFVFWPI